MSWKSWIMFSAAVSNIKKNVLNIVKKKRKKEYQSDLQCLSNFKTPFKGISVHETYFIILRTWQ